MKEAKKEKMSTQMSDLGFFWHWWQCRQNNLMAFLSILKKDLNIYALYATWRSCYTIQGFVVLTAFLQTCFTVFPTDLWQTTLKIYTFVFALLAE